MPTMASRSSANSRTPLNSIGSTFRFTSFGESHGFAVGGVIEGCPAGRVIDNDFIDRELSRRHKGDGTDVSVLTVRCDSDRVEWLSGLYQGRTLGTPLAFLLRNDDCRSTDYDSLRDCFRPGHADYTTVQRYGLRDHRGGGRASGRETAARVVAGAVAKQILAERHISFSATFHEHDVTCTVTGVPAGVGDPIFDRLNARLAHAMLSIPSAMAFAMGDTPMAYRLPQEQYPDQWKPACPDSPVGATATNHCGGIQGGISNGMPIVFHVGFHLPVTRPSMQCLAPDGTIHAVVHEGRHDVNHISRLPVIVEAMAALVVVDM